MNRYRMLDKKGEIKEDTRDMLYLKQGRQFLIDVDAALERLEKAALASGEILPEAAEHATSPQAVTDAWQFLGLSPATAKAAGRPSPPVSPSSLIYLVKSPQRVAIRDPRLPKAPWLEARVEEGKWRIHLSAIDQLKEEEKEEGQGWRAKPQQGKQPPAKKGSSRSR
jgi:hypothetical protein